MNTSERINSLLSLLEKEPRDSFLNYALALEYHKQGNSAPAIQLIEKVIAQDENYLGAYYQLGQLHEEAGNVAEALRVYQEGCRVAERQKNHKTLSELNQAIFLLED